MNIWLFAVLAAAVQAATPFHWEFDLRRCHRIYGGYDCFAAIDGKLAMLSNGDAFKRIDYQMYPHVVAINAQLLTHPDELERYQIIMQSRSRKQKVDVNFGMILSRIPENGKEENFVECRVVNGTVKVSTSPDLRAHLIDSYVADNHLYCDIALFVKKKRVVPIKMSEIVSERDQFALSVKNDGVVQKFVDGDVDSYKRSGWMHEYIAAILIHFKDYDRHKCDPSQVTSNLTVAPTGGKARKIEYFSDKLACPDDRYIIHVSDSKGRKMLNAKITCKDGQYEIKHNEFYDPIKGWTLESGETINAFCHVEDKNLCPISIPCEGSNCPYVKFDNMQMKYEVNCEDMFNNILVVGERESPFTWSGGHSYCNLQHNLVVKRKFDWEDRKYKSPPTDATEAYCAHEDTFYHPNCARRNPLCNGKSCSIVKSETLYKYDVTCKHSKHVFQEYSTKSKKWNKLGTKLRCKQNGDWDRTYQKFVRCKDPADTSAPVEE